MRLLSSGVSPCNPMPCRPYCHWVGGGSPLQRAPGPGTAITDPDVTSPGMTAQRCSRGLV